VTWRVIWPAALLAVNACAAVFRPGPASQEHSWRAYLGSSERATPVPATLAADPAPLWRVKVSRGVVGAPALTEDVVALSRQDRTVMLLDRRSGASLWQRNLGQDLGSGPLVDYDRVYVATQQADGRVMALDLARGRTLWSRKVGDVVAPLAAHDTQLYAATLGGEVVALQTTSGDLLWRTRVTGAVRAAPLLAGDALIVATTEDSLYVLDRSSGAVRARRATEGAVLAAPALADSVVLVGTATGRLEACDTATLAARWSVEAGSGIVGAVAVQRDTAFVVTEAGELWRVPLAAPDRAVKLALGIVTRAGPAPVAGGVLLVDVDGRLRLVDGAGATRWAARLRPPVVAPPLVDGAFILAASERGEVVAFQ
jgi:eukaryotic-like serine/threonine-protein kinase